MIVKGARLISCSFFIVKFKGENIDYLTLRIAE